MFGGDNELGNILQEAVKLKSAQMGQKRKTYETWPYFVQHTLFHGEKDDFKAWRQLPFPEKIKICERIKEDGNQLHAAGNFSDAVDKYEEAPTLVYYCYSTDPGWRKNNRGIDDDVLVLVDDTGTTEEEANQQKKLRMMCCLNIAACKQKIQKYDEAILACDTALELDPLNVKALYRRAEARVRPTKATAYDNDLAIKDLAKAHEVDPKNQVVEKLLTKLRGERKVQREKDQKTFTGMFNRGQIYDKKEGEDDAPLPGSDEAEMRAIQQRIESISDEDSLEKRTADAELLRDLYMRNGKEEEAKELNEKIQVAKKALRDRENSGLDWDNPTQEMVEDAKKYDLDLRDPLVVGELKRLEREGLSSTPPDVDGVDTEPMGDNSIPSPFDQPPEPPEADDGKPVPWMRYVGLFAVMFATWRLIDAGVVRWFAVWVWRRVIVRILYIFGVGRSEDADVDDERGSLFAFAYRKIASAFGSEADEVEL